MFGPESGRKTAGYCGMVDGPASAFVGWRAGGRSLRESWRSSSLLMAVRKQETCYRHSPYCITGVYWSWPYYLNKLNLNFFGHCCRETFTLRVTKNASNTTHISSNCAPLLRTGRQVLSSTTGLSVFFPYQR